MLRWSLPEAFIPSSRVALRPPPAVVFLLHPTGLEDTESSGPSKLVLTAVNHCVLVTFHFRHTGPRARHLRYSAVPVVFLAKSAAHTHSRGHIHTRARTHTGHNALLWLLLATVARRKIFRDGSNEKRKKWQTNSTNAFRKCPHYARRRSF